MKKWILTTLIATCLSLASCSKPATVGMKAEALDKISTGMSLEDVTAVLGQKGQKQSETAGIAAYTFSGADGFALAAMFTNGKLVSIVKLSENAEAGPPRRILSYAEALVEVIRTAEEVYINDNGRYISIGAISPKFPAGVCSLGPDTNGIVASPADVAEIKSVLDVNVAESAVEQWKVAVESNGQSFRVAVEGVAPETKGLYAVYDKACVRSASGSPPDLNTPETTP